MKKRFSKIVRNYHELHDECQAMITERMNEIKEFRFEAPFQVMAYTYIGCEPIYLSKIELTSSGVLFTDIDDEQFDLEDILRDEYVNILYEIM